ncbi:ERF superfamily [Campylobacter hyointestinalis subsp. hyointestinalis]|uniref:ERF superfamily n=1 Tax=Campylobacter hyointestinalis subsp. hyointestinalis TaxID=91352 RepID=A0A9W5AW34_CAMHY|nr:ERF family protein [Campylobacter hyointestinalis]CUU92474.1 ERF superfamily [Campylobacter hyointestinalis subsp. hyointestinalis]
MIELIKAQIELKAPKTQFNEYGKYQYRSCEDITEALKPLQEKYQFATLIDTEIVIKNGRFFVKATATILNKEGKERSTDGYAELPEAKKGMDLSQLTGSTTSYAKKIALGNLFSIDDTKDADATNTHGKDENATNTPKKDENKANKMPLSLEQINDLSELIEITNTDLNKFLAFFKTDKIALVDYETARDKLLEKLFKINEEKKKLEKELKNDNRP